MYAIAFDLDVAALKEHYPGPTHTNGYHEVRSFLEANGFGHQQGSVYFGNSDVNAVTTVLAVQALAREKPWFVQVVRDIRMLRIEENNDLALAVEQGAQLGGHPPKVQGPKPDQLDMLNDDPLGPTQLIRAA